MRLTHLAALAGAALVATTMATSADAAPAPHAAATQRIVVRPVTADGHLAGGFTVKDDDTSLDCTFNHGHGSVSTVAVDPHIFYCSPDAAYAIACWKSTRAHRVLCFRDGFRKEVIREKGTAPTHLAKPSATHNAINLRLAGGARCFARSGGAVGVQKHHPNWILTYFCGSARDAVWSPPHLGDTEGTDRTHARWTVWVGTDNGSLHKRAVTQAYFVGTAS
jgi:hypothetical protein